MINEFSSHMKRGEAQKEGSINVNSATLNFFTVLLLSLRKSHFIAR